MINHPKSKPKPQTKSIKVGFVAVGDTSKTN